MYAFIEIIDLIRTAGKTDDYEKNPKAYYSEAFTFGNKYGYLESVKKAKLYITRALFAGKNVEVGEGHGPVNHFFAPQKLKVR